MPLNTAYLRPGEFRICPHCSSRQKGLQKKCGQCGASLDGASIAARAFDPASSAPRPPNRGLRVVLVLTVIGAATIGVVLRNTFRSAAFDAAVAAENKNERVRADVAGPDPSVYERIAVPAPTEVPAWYGLGPRSAPPRLPASAIVEPGAYTADPTAVGGMVGIAPGSSGLGRRLRSGATITNDDLAAMRCASLAPPTPAPLDDRALVDRQRRLDAENELREAQRKVGALQIEADGVRRQSVTDPELREQQQHRLKELLDDLENAQKDVARAERKLREG